MKRSLGLSVMFGAAVMLTTGLAACGSSGGDGQVNFGTGLDSSHAVTGAKSTFAATEKFYYSAALKDTVKASTVHFQVFNPQGTKFSDNPLPKKTGDVNNVWEGPLPVAILSSHGGAGAYTIKVLSGSTEEASGTLTVSGAATSGQTSSQASS